ncbi:FepA family TonB-dependent siderophore receptor [Pelagerythrobacter sp.]|uniref:FepA family TonB-dependent siderophore receptor n=1 Tax=Pelagerythrobacter sp. TaxID=2800702 RepID=UPI0035B465D5
MKSAFAAFYGVSILAIAQATPAIAQDEGTPPAEIEDDQVAVGDTVRADDGQIVVTAERQAVQALGSTTISSEMLAEQPPVNDLADIIRRQPGINLTGAGSAGTYGNNRQIDIRGMGPENTLILVDGKPVSSRNSVRMGRDGERNSRGDTNWVPAEEVERIEILRGPAAARYGSGAAGGVINIITKSPADEFRGSVSGFVLVPEDTRESNTKRANFSVAGPIATGLGFRVFGNYSKTTADDPFINAEAADIEDGLVPPGGREGVENKDINGLLRWEPNEVHRFDIEGGFSRQGSEYSGEYRLGSGASSPITEALIGEETNVLKRYTGSGGYRGNFDFGEFEALVQFEETKNRRLNEGLAGGGEGTINTETEFSTSTLRNWFTQGTLDVPFATGAAQHVMTFGVEYRYEYLDDPYAVSNSQGIDLPGIDNPDMRDTESDADTVAAYVEDNVVLGRLTLTPGVRFDHHSTFGSNWSPSFSASYQVTPTVVIKGGIAKAFKAPNLYQSNPNYLYYTRGNGCPDNFPSLGGGCFIQGDENLEPETSVNKEVGIAFRPGGWNFSATYFRNDYDQKIIANNVPIGTAPYNGSPARIFQWYNTGKAIVEGLEGNVLIPFARNLVLSTNVTYMIRNEDRETGRLLSVIPEYTINSTLDWEITDDIKFIGTFTRYGKQTPNAILYSGDEPSDEQLLPRDPYNLVSANLIFEATEALRFSMGVNNLFDERLFRASSNNGAGANNYNEPGRAFFVQTNMRF